MFGFFSICYLKCAGFNSIWWLVWLLQTAVYPVFYSFPSFVNDGMLRQKVTTINQRILRSHIMPNVFLFHHGLQWSSLACLINLKKQMLPCILQPPAEMLDFSFLLNLRLYRNFHMFWRGKKQGSGFFPELWVLAHFFWEVKQKQKIISFADGP